MKKHRAFLLFCVSFLIGTGIGSWWRLPSESILVSLLFIFITSYFFRRPLLLALVGLSIALWWLPRIDQFRRGDIYLWNERGTVQLEGGVINFPEYHADHQVLYLRVSSLGGDRRAVSGVVRISLAPYPRYLPGDRITVTTKLKEVPSFDSFSYENYLYPKHVFSLALYPKEFKKIGESFTPYRSLFRLRNALEKIINRLLPEPSSSLLAGILFGIRRNIPDDITEIFQVTGTSHILAVSGYNISILIATVTTLIRGRASPRYRLLLSLLFVIFFVVLCGASASVVRAAIMGLLAYTLRGYRRVRPVAILIFAATIMIICNPKLLLFDAGFQLSFAATSGILIYADHLESVLSFLPKTFGIRETLVATLASHTLLLPLLILSFQRLSLIALFTNVLVLPLVPIIMATGGAAIVLASLVPFLTLGSGLVPHLLITLMITILRLLSELPYAAINLPTRSGLIFLPYIFFLFMWYAWIQRTRGLKKSLSLSLE